MTAVTVALLGLGNVGRSFIRFATNPDNTPGLSIQILAAADSSGGIVLESAKQLDSLTSHKETGGRIADFAHEDLVRDLKDFVCALPSAGVSVLVESLPTEIQAGQPALDLLCSALERGVSVVTVDKGPVVHGLDRLNQASLASGAGVRFTGTTGVPIPEVAGNDLLEIRGVLNGTTNYILTEMQERGTSFDQALARAQQDGIAEPDPSLDMEGWDTAAKILILAKSLMGAEATLTEVSRIGIGRETEGLITTGRESGRIVRLIGRARIWKGKVRVSVAPKLVNADSPFFAVSGTSKLAVFTTESRGDVISAANSGRDAIAATIVEDIRSLAVS